MMIFVISYPAATFWKNCELWYKSKRSATQQNCCSQWDIYMYDHSPPPKSIAQVYRPSLSIWAKQYLCLLEMSFYANNYFLSASFVCCWLIMQSWALSVIPHLFCSRITPIQYYWRGMLPQLDNACYQRDRHNDLTHTTRWGCGSTDFVMSH